ncbi:hypothetical protein HGRIS_014754 [Hohenbuehelia grisea]|uniref:Mitochondrial chaperone BCS1 n=1 Tax=Hohenbuehelia grisea TaxID=104357 RepID=A0ABR3IQR5_9AGAR
MNSLDYSITASFMQGDPTYDWMILFLTREKVWQRSRNFNICLKTSARKFGIQIPSNSSDDNETDGDKAEYVPKFNIPQLFWWRGYWIEVQRVADGGGGGAAMTLTIYTLDLTVLKSLIDEAQRQYVEVSKPHVLVYSSETRYGAPFTWNKVKNKSRRPMDSIILPERILDSVVEDMRDFIKSENWYLEAGIPYRRGYLLYGPPGTGKSSTVYTLASELGLEIYSLSLASPDLDDTAIQRAASMVPKHGVLLIEDIDCAFPSREDEEQMKDPSTFDYASVKKRSSVTLSGLLNVLDGVDSDEGKFFIATTNYVDRLDPALMRPGRIDVRVKYNLATKQQAAMLFTRFFPASRFNGSASKDDTSEKREIHDIPTLAAQFASSFPEHEFTTAELQGYLLPRKARPREAAEGIIAWVAHERSERAARAARDAARAARAMDVLSARSAKTFANLALGSGQPFPFMLSPVPMRAAPGMGSAMGGMGGVGGGFSNGQSFPDSARSNNGGGQRFGASPVLGTEDSSMNTPSMSLDEGVGPVGSTEGAKINGGNLPSGSQDMPS